MANNNLHNLYNKLQAIEGFPQGTFEQFEQFASARENRQKMFNKLQSIEGFPQGTFEQFEQAAGFGGFNSLSPEQQITIQIPESELNLPQAKRQGFFQKMFNADLMRSVPLASTTVGAGGLPTAGLSPQAERRHQARLHRENSEPSEEEQRIAMELEQRKQERESLRNSIQTGSAGLSAGLSASSGVSNTQTRLRELNREITTLERDGKNLKKQRYAMPTSFATHSDEDFQKSYAEHLQRVEQATAVERSELETLLARQEELRKIVDEQEKLVLPSSSFANEEEADITEEQRELRQLISRIQNLERRIERKTKPIRKKDADLLVEHQRRITAPALAVNTDMRKQADALRAAGNMTSREFNTFTALSNETNRILNAPNRNEQTDHLQDWGNYFRGIGQNLIQRDTWTLGFTEIARNVHLAGIEKRFNKQKQLLLEQDIDLTQMTEEQAEAFWEKVFDEMSDAEALILNAFALNAHAQGIRAEDISLAYQGGEGLAKNLPFMAEFMLVGGMSAVARKAIYKSLMKQGKKQTAVALRNVLEGGTYARKNLGGGIVSHTAGNVGTAALMPSTWATVSRDYLDSVIDGEQYDGMGFARSVTGMITEVISEKTVENFINFGIMRAGQRYGGSFGRGYSRIGRKWREGPFRHVPLYDPLSEILGEYSESAMTYIRSFNPLYDDKSNAELRAEAAHLWTLDGQAVMMASIVPMTFLPVINSTVRTNLPSARRREATNLMYRIERARQGKDTVLQERLEQELGFVLGEAGLQDYLSDRQKGEDLSVQLTEAYRSGNFELSAQLENQIEELNAWRGEKAQAAMRKYRESKEAFYKLYNEIVNTEIDADISDINVLKDILLEQGRQQTVLSEALLGTDFVFNSNEIGKYDTELLEETIRQVLFDAKLSSEQKGAVLNQIKISVLAERSKAATMRSFLEFYREEIEAEKQKSTDEAVVVTGVWGDKTGYLVGNFEIEINNDDLISIRDDSGAAVFVDADGVRTVIPANELGNIDISDITETSDLLEIKRKEIVETFDLVAAIIQSEAGLQAVGFGDTVIVNTKGKNAKGEDIVVEHTGVVMNKNSAGKFIVQLEDGSMLAVRADDIVEKVQADIEASQKTNHLDIQQEQFEQNAIEIRDWNDAESFLLVMESNAEIAQELELTPENWYAEFGETGIVETPAGEVKMGENQYLKLHAKKRGNQFGMVKPTLINPDVIIEKQAIQEGAERNTKLLFVKTFIDNNGQKHIFFESVTVRQDGMEVSISSHIADRKTIAQELINGTIVYNKFANSSESYLAENRNGLPDIVPTQANSTDKSTNTIPNAQEIEQQKQDFLNSLPINNKGEYIFDKFTPEQKLMFSELDNGRDLAVAVARKGSTDIQARIDDLNNKLVKVNQDLASGDLNAINRRNSLQAQITELQAEKAVYDSYIQDIQEVERAELERKAAEMDAQRAQQEQQRKEWQAANEAQRLAEIAEIESLKGIPDVTTDTAEKARLRGYRNVSGTRVDRNGIIPVESFTETSRKFADRQIVPVQRTIVEAGAVEPSHMGGVRNNKFFITEAQPKERTDKASAEAENQIASNIHPEEITGSVGAFQGAPVVNARGEVIQGNNRVKGLKTMYQSHKANAEKYKQYLIDHAADYGMTAEQVRAMRHPVAVDIAAVSDAEAIRLGQYQMSDLESGGEQRMSVANVARGLGKDIGRFAQMLFPQTAEEMSMSEQLDENGKQAFDYLHRKKLINNTVYQSAFDSKGRIKPEAKKDLQDVASFVLFTGANDNMRSMFGNLPDKARKAILQTIHRDAQSAAEDSILHELREAIEAYNILLRDVDFAERKTFAELRVAVEDARKQTALFNTENSLPLEKYSNFVLNLAVRFKADSQAGLRSRFNGLYDSLQGVGGNLLELAEKLTKAEAVKKHFNIDNYVSNGQIQRTDVGELNHGASGRGASVGAGTRSRDIGELQRGIRSREQNTARERTSDSRGRTERDNRTDDRAGVVERSDLQDSSAQVKKYIPYWEDKTIDSSEYIKQLQEAVESLRKIKDFDKGIKILGWQTAADLYLEISKELQNYHNGQGISESWSKLIDENSGQWLLNNIYYSFDKKSQQELDRLFNKYIQSNEQGNKTRLGNRQTVASHSLFGALGSTKARNGIERTLVHFIGRRSGATAGASIQGGWNKSSFKQGLKEQAQANGTWIDDISTLGSPSKHLIGGFENELYISNDVQHVIKLNNFNFLNDTDGQYANTRDFDYFLDRLNSHNELFPKDKYEILGFAENSKGEICIVLQQPFVVDARLSSVEQIDAHLAKIGFKKGTLSNGLQGYSNGMYELSDAKSANVLIDTNGDLRFIDLDISSRAFFERNSKEDKPVQTDIGDKQPTQTLFQQGTAKNFRTITKTQHDRLLAVLKRTGLARNFLIDAQAEALLGAEGIRVFRGLSELSKAHTVEQFILDVLNGKIKKGKQFISIPERANRLAEKAIGHEIKSHSIHADEIRHIYNKHGEGNKNLSKNEIPLRKEDIALLPYIMAAPDRVEKGTNAANGTESVRYIKELSNGIVVVVEREGKFSANEMENVTMWANKKSHSSYGAVALNTPRNTSETLVISPNDIAKIRKDFETTKQQVENNLRMLFVWHGSPYSFDRFDKNKFLSGEGSMAYGAGFYFTDKKSISEYYAQNKQENIYINGVQKSYKDLNNAQKYAVGVLNSNNFNKELSIAEIERVNSRSAVVEIGKAAIEFLQNNSIELRRGNIYNVKIHGDKTVEDLNFIRWDKTLTKSQIEVVKNIFNDIVNQTEDYREASALSRELYELAKSLHETTASEVYGTLAVYLGSQEAASEALLEYGIDGVQYPTESTIKGSHENSFNYVVFDANAIEIQERIRPMATSKGEIYGFVTKEGDIWIDSNHLNANTPIHEFGHLYWSAAMPAEMKAKITELLKQTPEWKRLEDNPAYAHLKTDDAKADEIFNTLLGNYGQNSQRVNEIIGNDISLFARIISALNEFWNWLKAQFGDLQAQVKVFAKQTLEELLSGERIRELQQIESTRAQSPLVVTDINGTHNVIDLNNAPELDRYLRNNNVTSEDVNQFQRWLNRNKENYVRLYHGTASNNPISEQGILRTTANRKKSYQSESGYVYLSRYPSSARLFGEMNNTTGRTAVYAVDVKIKELLPDTDQLNNQRAVGNNVGNTLAESLIFGNGARVRRDIMPYELSETRFDSQIQYADQADFDFDVSGITANNAQEMQRIKENEQANGTFMLAPNGKKTNLNERAWLQVRTEAFKAWFGDWENDPENASKVVDSNGEPMVVYHRSPNVFTTFDRSRIGSNTDAGWIGSGFYFYGEVSESYGYGSYSYETFLNVRGPYYVSNEQNLDLAEQNDIDVSNEFSREVQSEGHDGSYFNGDFRQEWVVFNPNQIKSATDNNGNFDNTSDDIRFHFIGEQGARNYAENTAQEYSTPSREHWIKGMEDDCHARLTKIAEAQARLDNLGVAREMETAFEAKKARIDKLLKSEPIEITGNEHQGRYELNRDSAKDYILNNLRKPYTNKDTGESIIVSRRGANEVTSHGERDVAHLQSIVAIPQIIENAVFISEEAGSAGSRYDVYRYYVVGLKIGGVDYTVKMVVGRSGNSYYYDHALTQIEKGNLIEATRLSNSLDNNTNTLSEYKDRRLISILQTNERENARKIKIATGWERGADGKWRYEIADVRVNVNNIDLRRRENYLTNIVEGRERAELFEVYPELQSVKITVKNIPSGRAHWNRENNEIALNRASFDKGDVKGINVDIIHELQHAIQDIEGFASGSNSSSSRLLDYMTSVGNLRILQARFDEFWKTPLGKKIDAEMDAFLDQNVNPTDGQFREFERELLERHPEYKHFQETVSERLDSEKKKPTTSKDAYRRTAGEVEARNTETRINMTLAERRASLAEETEDVSRADQIFLYANLGVSNASAKPRTKQGIIREVNEQVDAEIKALQEKRARAMREKKEIRNKFAAEQQQQLFERENRTPNLFEVLADFSSENLQNATAEQSRIIEATSERIRALEVGRQARIDAAVAAFDSQQVLFKNSHKSPLKAGTLDGADINKPVFSVDIGRFAQEVSEYHKKNTNFARVQAAAAAYDNATTNEERRFVAFDLADALNEAHGKTNKEYAYKIFNDSESYISTIELEYNIKLSNETIERIKNNVCASFNEDTKIASFIVSNINNSKKFIESWIHENIHREVHSKYDVVYLEKVFYSLDEKIQHRIKKAFTDAGYEKLSNASLLNEALAYLAEEFYRQTAKSRIDLTNTEDIKLIAKISKIDNVDFNNIFADVYNRLMNNKTEEYEKEKENRRRLFGNQWQDGISFNASQRQENTYDIERYRIGRSQTNLKPTYTGNIEQHIHELGDWNKGIRFKIADNAGESKSGAFESWDAETTAKKIAAQNERILSDHQKKLKQYAKQTAAKMAGTKEVKPQTGTISAFNYKIALQRIQELKDNKEKARLAAEDIKAYVRDNFDGKAVNLINSRGFHTLMDRLVNASHEGNFNQAVKEINQRLLQLQIAHNRRVLKALTVDGKIVYPEVLYELVDMAQNPLTGSDSLEDSVFSLLDGLNSYNQFFEIENRSKRGVSVAKNVDGHTRETIAFVRSNYDTSLYDLTQIEVEINERLEKENAQPTQAEMSKLVAIELLRKLDEIKSFEYELKLLKATEFEEFKDKGQVKWRAIMIEQQKLLEMQAAMIKEFVDLWETGRCKLQEWKEAQVKRVNEQRDELFRMSEYKLFPNNQEEFETRGKMRQLWDAYRDSFEYLAQAFDYAHLPGTGEFYRRHIYGDNGLLSANRNIYMAMRDNQMRMNNKAEEIFGKLSLDEKAKTLFSNKLAWLKKEWDKDSGYTLHYTNRDDIPTSQKMTIGQLALQYCYWKQEHTRLTQERMQFDYMMAEIEYVLGQKNIAYADWLQDEFLPSNFDRYNEAHFENNGLYMTNTAFYMPAKYTQTQIRKSDNVVKDTTPVEGEIMSIAPGSWINRRKGGKPDLDLQANLLQVIDQHLADNERACYLERTIQDLRKALNNPKLAERLNRNDKDGMKRLKNAITMAIGQYQVGQYDAFDEVSKTFHKRWATSRIAFGGYTALKQALSYHAFLAYENSDAKFAYQLQKNFFEFEKNWQWAIENMPLFEERWNQRNAGNIRIDFSSKSDVGKLLDLIAQGGMYANRAMDRLTIAAGSRTVYECGMRVYQKQGMSKEEAHKLALRDAETMFNRTQQTARQEYKVPLQASKRAVAQALTTFQSQQILYFVESNKAYLTLTRGKEQRNVWINNLVKQGLSLEEATIKVDTAIGRALPKLGLYAYLQWVWYFVGGAGAPMFINALINVIRGDDDDNERIYEILLNEGINATLRSVPSYLPFGGTWDTAINALHRRGNIVNPNTGSNMFVIEVAGILQRGIGAFNSTGTMNSDVWRELCNLSALAIGVNFSKAEDIYKSMSRFSGIFQSDDVAFEATIGVLELLTAPRSLRSTLSEQWFYRNMKPFDEVLEAGLITIREYSEAEEALMRLMNDVKMRGGTMRDFNRTARDADRIMMGKEWKEEEKEKKAIRRERRLEDREKVW